MIGPGAKAVATFPGDHFSRGMASDIPSADLDS